MLCRGCGWELRVELVFSFWFSLLLEPWLPLSCYSTSDYSLVTTKFQIWRALRTGRAVPGVRRGREAFEVLIANCELTGQVKMATSDFDWKIRPLDRRLVLWLLWVFSRLWPWLSKMSLLSKIRADDDSWWTVEEGDPRPGANLQKILTKILTRILSKTLDVKHQASLE